MFKILPRRGSTACVRLSRPCLAEPPAESPSTRKISDSVGSSDWQSDNFPGSTVRCITDFERSRSRAAFAASAARAAAIALAAMAASTFGLKSKKACSCSETRESTAPRTSVDPSFDFVCPSNSGFGSLTVTTAVKPSRIYSPEREPVTSLAPFIRFGFGPSAALLPPVDVAARFSAEFTTRVRATLSPSTCEPPAGVWIPFANANTLSE
mmetsp:Transcript_31688/g.79150  ORF Transcript_31688/g.79150 Transcript_31688/m.79150 type:complete len:210 (+) Transcript_31688:765-1394(+)